MKKGSSQLKYSALVDFFALVCLLSFSASAQNKPAGEGEARIPAVAEHESAAAAEASEDDWNSDEWGAEDTTVPETPPEYTYSLERLRKLALERNVGMREAEWREKFGQAQAMEAWWAWWPEIKVLSALSAAPDYNAPDPKTDPLGFVSYSKETDPTSTGLDGVVWGAELTLTQPLFTFGKIWNTRKLGPLAEQYGKENLRKTKSKLINDVTRLYYSMLLLSEMQRVLKEGQGYIDDATDQLKKMLEEGAEGAEPEDLYKLELMQSEKDARAEEIREGRELSLKAMRVLLNLPADQPVYLDRDRLPPAPGDDVSFDDLLKLMRNERPEIRMLKLGAEMADRKKRIEWGKFFPDFFLRLVYDYRVASEIQDIRNPFFNDPYNKNSFSGYLGLQYKFDIPLQIARHRQAEYEKARFDSSREYLEEGMALELKQAVEKLITAARQAEIRKRSFKTGKKWVTAALMDYSLGIHDPDNIMDALSTYFQTQLNYYSAVQKALLAKCELDLLAAAYLEEGNNLPSENKNIEGASETLDNDDEEEELE